MLERHIQTTKLGPYKNNVGLKLYPYDGGRVVCATDSLRSSPYSSRELLSEVFIFEKSVNFIILFKKLNFRIYLISMY